MKNIIGKVEKYTIYIGLKDKDSIKQLFSTEDFINIIKGICINKRIEFTMSNTYGGYINETGNLLYENSIVLSLMEINEDEVVSLCEELRLKLNQESITYTKEYVDVVAIK